MIHQPTITEIVSFILRHRCNNAFTTETPEELYECLQAAIAGNSMLVDCDDFGSINGVIVAKFFENDSRLHIHAILCNSKSSLGKFAYWLLQTSKQGRWTISATRRGKSIEYRNTKRLLQFLSRKYSH